MFPKCFGKNISEEFERILKKNFRHVSWSVCAEQYTTTGRYIRELPKQVYQDIGTWSCLPSVSNGLGMTNMF